MTATFNLNKTNIITRAFQIINVIDLNAIPDTDNYNYASDILNLLIKKWEAQGLNLWKRKIGYCFSAQNIASYALGSSGTNATNNYISTTLTVAASGTSLTVASTAGMTTNDYIGVELSNGSRQWSTIASVLTSTTLSINDSITSNSGATVVSYTTKLTRPLRIIRGTCLNLKNNNTESKLAIIGHDEYFDTPIKTTAGQPNQIYYDKLLNGSTPYTGTLYCFPRPNDCSTIISFSYQESLSDLTNSTDYADFPQEWGYALIFNLACELAYHYGKFAQLQMLQPKADQELSAVQTFDSDDADLHIK